MPQPASEFSGRWTKNDPELSRKNATGFEDHPSKPGAQGKPFESLPVGGALLTLLLFHYIISFTNG